MADVISIFRNGAKVGDFKTEELDAKKLSYYMTGHEVEYPRYHRTCTDNTPILEIDGLTRKGQYQDISLSIRPGDIIGLTGLLGSGRAKLAMSLFGLNPTQASVVRMDGKKVKITFLMAVKKLGIALLPEDRFTQGLFWEHKIKENVSSALVSDISPHHILDLKQEAVLAQQNVEDWKKPYLRASLNF